MNLPQWVENAYELLDEDREWYLNRAAGYLYYKPGTGENFSAATVTASKLETLVSGVNVHNVQFNGLTFSYATWLRPNSTEGYADVQSGFCIIGAGNTNFDATRPYWAKTPGNVTFTASKAIRFERNTFTHLGAVAVNFEGGSQNNMIIGNLFQDISSSAVQLGQINDANEINEANKNKDNTVSNNYITQIATE